MRHIDTTGIPVKQAMTYEFMQQRQRFKALLIQRFQVSEHTYDQISQLLAPIVQPFRLRKGEYLQRSGEAARNLRWLTQGVARVAYLTESGSEVTLRFAMEGDTANAFEDLLQTPDEPAGPHFIIAETSVAGFSLEWADLLDLRTQHQVITDYHIKVLEYRLKQHAQRNYQSSASDAQSRLDTFRTDYPGLEQRISQKVLASYLGITPPYLSQLLRQPPSD